MDVVRVSKKTGDAGTPLLRDGDEDVVHPLDMSLPTCITLPKLVFLGPPVRI